MATIRNVEEVLGALDRKIDRRGVRVFPTVSSALKSLDPEERAEGMAAWIESKRAIYRFIGGVENVHFVPEGANCFNWKVT